MAELRHDTHQAEGATSYAPAIPWAWCSDPSRSFDLVGGQLAEGALPSRPSLSLEPVAGLSHGDDVHRLCRIRLELRAELGHVNVDGARADIVLVAPHGAQQVAAWYDNARLVHQRCPTGASVGQ
jgi:hypothetical protein